MPWLLPPQGRTDSELLAAGTGQMHVGNMPAYGRRNQWADAIASIAPAVMSYLKQKRQDEIANQLMNMEQPPRAEAVDPSLQGAPATRPFTGGAEGFKAHQLYQDYINKQQDRQYQLESRQPDTAMDDLHYWELYRKTHPEEFPQNNAMTAYQRESLRLRQERENRLTDKQPKGTDIISKQGLSVQDLDTPNLIKYYRQEGDNQTPVSGDEAAKNPAGVFANPPGSKQFIPIEQWQAAASSFRQKHQPKVMGQETDQSKAPTLDKTPVQVKSIEEANALPSGTMFLTPDGRLKRKP